MEESFVFIGRVVFGNGEPVADAKVSIMLSSVYGPKGEKMRTGGNYEIKRTTDSEGYFTVDDSGIYLLIQTIDGPGLLLDEVNTLERDFRIPGNLYYGFSKTSATAHYVPDPDDPAVLVLVRPNEVITTWPSRGGKDAYTTGQENVNTPLMPKRPSVPLVETEEGWVYRPDY